MVKRNTNYGFHMIFAITVMVISFICVIAVLKKYEKNNKTKIVVVEKPVYVEKTSEPPIYPKNNPRYNERLNYQQVGVLVSQDMNDSEPIILPLYGRVCNRDRWQYYVASDKYHMWRLPITFKNRDCQDEYVGCEEIYDSDPVTVPDYANKIFKARIYKYALN